MEYLFLGEITTELFSSLCCPWVSSEALCSPVFSFPMLVAGLSGPFLVESWVEQWELGTAGGGEVGWEKEGHCYGWSWASLWSFFSLKGDQIQWARQEGVMALSFVLQRTPWATILWPGTWSFRQWIWSLSGLLIPKMAFVPSVESLSTFEFLHDFMKLLIFYPLSSGPSWHVGSCRNCTPGL